MEAILTWQIDWIVAVQSVGGQWMTGVANLLSFLGSELFFLLVMPAVLWCYDASLGLRTGLVLMTSATINGIAKLALRMPRPSWIDLRVQALAEETSYGIPSGHAQNAVVLWGYLAYHLRRWWATLAAIVLILAISSSRIVLGVHFPTDVLAGWMLGAVVLALFVLLEDPVSRWLKARPFGLRLLIAALAPLALLAVGAVVVQAAPPGGPWPFGPAESPHSLRGVVSSAAALMGLSLGGVQLANWAKFDGRLGGFWKRLARLAVGLAGVILIYLGLRQIFPEGEIWRFVRYGLVGWWVAYGAPRTFVAARLDR